MNWTCELLDCAGASSNDLHEYLDYLHECKEESRSNPVAARAYLELMDAAVEELIALECVINSCLKRLV